jgi:hypothetical protein
VNATLDRDSVQGQMLLPNSKVIRGNRESEMQRSIAVVRAERAKGQLCDAIRCATLEQQQDAASSYAIGAQAVIAMHLREAE